jgi:2-polyprenyl-6-methoxyphenol hydroxylase-like FAD-dependent oxidoreductase
MTEMDADVLVVGAGPTGLMLANQLVRRGVRVQIIDRHAGPSLQTRALGVQARTLEIYAKLGIADRALQLGKRGTGATLWAQGRKIDRLSLSERGLDNTPYPYILILGQDDNEKIMGENLDKLGEGVEWNTELVGLNQDADGVTATLKLADGTAQSLRVAWVAGCDGARSAVRELSGITFPGAPYEHVFFVADVEMTGHMAAEEVNVYLWREGFHLLFPMRGLNHWRIVGILPEELRGKEGVTFDTVIPSLRKEAGAELDFRNCSWFSTYRIHHRSASRFRDRRCFLLGDAAHIHSPVGAQGMNTGLQDAYNLAWKLALVVKGKAGEALLGSYEAERIPVARRLLNTTDRAFKLIVADNWLAGLFRTKILAWLAAFALSRKSVQEFAFRTVSQIAINYRKSPISKSLPGLPDTAPQAGDRFPWLRYRLKADGPLEDLYQKRDDTKFNLIVIGQLLEKPLDFGGLLNVYGIASGPLNAKELARWHLPQTSFYLLRPDGHVGLCGTRLDVAAIKRYLSANLHFTV